MSMISSDCLSSSAIYLGGHDQRTNADTLHLCRFIQQVGTVETQDQRKELFGDAADTEPTPALTEPAQASQIGRKQE